MKNFTRLAFLPALTLALAPLLLLTATAFAPRIAADPSSGISRTPPPLYTETIAPLLTPLDDATKLIPEIHDKDANGIVLLDERLNWLDPQGRRTMVSHTACKCLVEAGVESIASDTFTYRKHDQKFTLVLAETIQPDGAVLPVKDNAIILQTPQRQADNALYDDLAEVRVIYPNVKPGSITRSITIIEDQCARMPGEYSQCISWGAGWPVAISRDVVDLPAPLAQRLRLFPLGSNVPAHTIEKNSAENENASIRYLWRATLVPALKYEPRRAPTSQTGPAITLTTIASWDDIARWYSSLTRGRDTPSPALAAKADDWTRDLDASTPAGRDAIIRTLFAKVANDVRYTGLEFGDSDYQPHDCNEVWENQYGDCKDKANLLCALLRYKNIPAHIALLDTDHLGLIDRRAPNFRIFDHVIVAIPDTRAANTADAGNAAVTDNAAATGNNYLFCDPTITWAEPGTLSNGDTDRDTLVINETAADWVRTPQQKNASTAYNLALQLAPAGEISGWLTVTTKGYPACGWRSWARSYDTDGLRRAFQQQVRDFYDGASVIDAAAEPAATTTGPCVAKTYFIVPGNETAVHTLAFPLDNDLLPYTGNSAQRATTYPLAQGRTTITATIKLPPGLAPSRQVEPYRVTTPSLTAAASWDYSPLTQTCRAKLDIDITQPSVPAAEFGRFYQAMQSLRAWLQQPLVLATATANTGPRTSDSGLRTPNPSALQPFSPSALSLDFPLMPTGAGQLDLAETRYPIDDTHDRALARAAQEKILQYFPNDKSTTFAATVNLSLIDWYAGNNQQAHDRLAPLLDTRKNDVTPERYSWAEYVQALILHDLKRDAEAIAICHRLALDTRFTAYRRANAALKLYDIAGQNDPAKTMTALDAVADLRSDNETDILTAIARLSLRQNADDAPLRARLEKLLQTRPADAQTTLAAIINKSKT